MESFKRFKIVLGCLFILFSNSAMGAPYVNTLQSTSNKNYNQENIDVIDQRLVAITLNLSKGISSNNKNLPYTFVHQFYMPLLYASATNNVTLTNSFAKLMVFENVSQIRKSKVLTDLDKKVFYFFVAEYLRNFGVSTQNNKRLFNLVKEETLAYWNIKPAKVWSAEKPDFHGAKQRIDFILNGGKVKRSYYGAVTDSELFVMAAGVSLAITESKDRQTISYDLDEIGKYFLNVLNKLVVFNSNNTWLLQPGIWKDHPDYRHSSDYSWDVSHFSRFPAYLNLLSIYTAKDRAQNNYVKKLRIGLTKQLMSKVVSFNNGSNVYTFNNFMSGDNNRYRVGYKTKISGYSGSENNLHVFYGWWKLLDNMDINKMYNRIALSFSSYKKANPQIEKLSSFYRALVGLEYVKL